MIDGVRKGVVGPDGTVHPAPYITQVIWIPHLPDDLHDHSPGRYEVTFHWPDAPWLPHITERIPEKAPTHIHDTHREILARHEPQRLSLGQGHHIELTPRVQHVVVLSLYEPIVDPMTRETRWFHVFAHVIHESEDGKVYHGRQHIHDPELDWHDVHGEHLDALSQRFTPEKALAMHRQAREMSHAQSDVNQQNPPGPSGRPDS